MMRLLDALCIRLLLCMLLGYMLTPNIHASEAPSKPSLLGTEYLIVGTLYVYEVTKNR